MFIRGGVLVAFARNSRYDPRVFDHRYTRMWLGKH